MRVVMNAFPLLAPKSGVGYYAYHLARALAKGYGAEDEYIYFYGRRFSREIIARAPELDAAARRVLKWLLRDPYIVTQPVKEFFFRRGVRDLGVDVYHELNYVLMPFEGPQVVTVFDLSIKRYPETHPSARVRFFNKYFDARLGRATRIIAISEFTKRELMAVMGVGADRIVVTPLAPPEGFGRPEREAIEAFRARQGLPKEFILYLGNLEPRKNLDMLVRAYRRLCELEGDAPALVLAGEATWMSESLVKEIKRCRLEGRVLRPGYVREDELALWYGAATIFVYPSRYEGFGLPVVEAMAAGTPVIAADVEALREVAGEAARYVGPDDEERWAVVMAELLNAPVLRAELAHRGLARAAEYSWARCAAETRAVYEEAIRGWRK
ncbi:MAG: glycosyltransferase family 4 protein [bacterium]|nr:glycosyltransferase family 4 protein [bacterium]